MGGQFTELHNFSYVPPWPASVLGMKVPIQCRCSTRNTIWCFVHYRRLILC